jgi:hypothetical protein
MVLRTLVRLAGVAVLGVAAALGAVAVGTTPVGAGAAAAVESGFLRLRRSAVAAAVMVASVTEVMVAAVMEVMVAAVMVVGDLWIKSWLR